MRATLASRMTAAGATSGFDYLRLGLALAIVGLHSVAITTGDDLFIWQGPWRPLAACLVPLFFAISGFLVADSYARSSSLTHFCVYRLVRIIPALSIEVMLTALVLGAVFTSMPVAAYFSNGALWSYLLNILGLVQHELPGVYHSNPLPGQVNVQLWTIPYELACYFALPVVALLGLRLPRYRAEALLGFAILVTLYLSVDMGRYLTSWIDIRQACTITIPSFLWGAVLYVWRDRVPLGAGYLFAAAVIMAVALADYNTAMLATPFVAYTAVSLGLCNPRRVWLVRSGDYSYGVYLAGFPLQQAVMALWPAYPYWWANLLFSLPLVGAYAFFSWHCIEKYPLKYKASLASALRRMPLIYSKSR